MQRVHKLNTASLAKRTTFSEEPVRSSESVEPEETHHTESKIGWARGINVYSWLQDVTPFEWDILLASTCLKLLLFPA